MNYNSLKSEQIVEFFESCPIKDFEFLFKFHKTYLKIITALNEAFENIAYQRDLYDIYIEFYATETVSYQYFCRLIKEMKDYNLINVAEGNSNVIMTRKKGFMLLNQNQSDVPLSRMSKASLLKSKQLAKLHIQLTKNFKGYHPCYLVQHEKLKHVYQIAIKDHIFIYYLLTSDCIAEQKMINQIKDLKVKNTFRFNAVRIFTVGEDADAKRYLRIYEKIKKVEFHHEDDQLNYIKLEF